MRRVVIILVLVCGVWGAALWADYTLPDEGPPPASPREFHDQEFARHRSALLEPPPALPILSTQADYDAVYYDLTLDLRGYYSQTISGDVRVLARSLAVDFNELILDLCSDLVVDSILCEGSQLPFEHEDNLLTMELPRVYTTDELVEVRVIYHGTPCATSYYDSFYFFTRSTGGRQIPTVYTLSEPYGARDWWPSKNTPADKADSARIAIIVADTLTATSNGVLESVTDLPDSARMFTWVERYPIASYLIVVNATNYAHYRDWYVTQDGDSMPIDHYPYPERLTHAQTSWNVVPAMLDFCAETFGEYPFATQKYGHTMFSFIGAMEHQCNTSYGRAITTGTHSYDYIVLHEIAHQWWGDEVTLASWPDIWLNEGFASYSEALWFEHLGGFEAYHNYMILPSGLDVVDPSGPVYNPTDLLSSNSVYDKGAWILHMLRGVVRDDSLFFAGLRHYRAQHAGGSATTEQFLADFSAVVGYDITPYLANYLYLTNRPHFAVSYGTAPLDGSLRTMVRVRQTQTNPSAIFPSRMDLRFAGAADTAWLRIESNSWENRFVVDLDFAPATVTLDPHDWVLKAVVEESLPLTILSDTLAVATVGEPYLDTLAAIAGQEPFFWSRIENPLPDGLTLSPGGILSGTPVESGGFSFRVRVTDSQSDTDKGWLYLQVNAALPQEPPAPQHVTAYPVGDDLIEIRWCSVPEAEAYHVYRSRTYEFLEPIFVATTLDTFLRDTLRPVEEDSNVVRIYRVHSVAGE